MATTRGLCGCLIGESCGACDPMRAEVARAVGDGSFSDAKQLYAGQVNNENKQFVIDVLKEVARARAKFPDSRSEITGLALGEESGEAQRALLHIYEGKGGEADLYLECVQTAAMALRLALESADRTNWRGNTRGCGGSYEIGSGGHVPGIAGEGCEACDRDFGQPQASPLKKHSFKRRKD